jgi:hypothetical protein
VHEPDIQPQRMSSIDVLSLSNIERVAVLIHLAGHSDPVVAASVVDATEKVLTRTRVEGDILLISCDKETLLPSGRGPEGIPPS